MLSPAPAFPLKQAQTSLFCHCYTLGPISHSSLVDKVMPMYKRFVFPGLSRDVTKIARFVYKAIRKTVI